jgi:SAM-dependent methyltransferase
MYDTLNILIEDNTQSNWLAVGDGNYGHGTNHILSKGGNCLATDISIDYLKRSKQLGYIKEYQYANAENLPFDDNSYDYSFVKESYHHFPRPTIALYEMLRVSRKGIVLIEPNDSFTGSNKIRIFLRFILKMFGKKEQRHQWEVSGNYVFTIQRRDIEKIALGLNYKFIAFKGLNDHFISGAKNEILSDNGPIGKKIINVIKWQDLFCRFNLTDHALLTSIILKEEPSKELIAKLANDGFETTVLPNNPYA